MTTEFRQGSCHVIPREAFFARRVIWAREAVRALHFACRTTQGAAPAFAVFEGWAPRICQPSVFFPGLPRIRQNLLTSTAPIPSFATPAKLGQPQALIDDKSPVTLKMPGTEILWTLMIVKGVRKMSEIGDLLGKPGERVPVVDVALLDRHCWMCHASPEPVL